MQGEEGDDDNRWQEVPKEDGIITESRQYHNEFWCNSAKKSGIVVDFYC